MKRRARSCLIRGDGRKNALYAAPLCMLNEPQNGFMRGAIAAGLLAAISPDSGRKDVLKRTLQGGTTLAAGIAGANALDRRDLGSLLFALAAGAAGLAAIDYLLPNSQPSQKASPHE